MSPGSLQPSTWLYTGACVLAGLTAGCTEEVLQTAELGSGAPGAPITCDAPPPAAAIDWPELLGGAGELGESPFVVASYGALEGPGLYVVARDAFRVYFNGVLVASSAADRTPAFIPLTVPPGDNVVAVALAAHAGAPAALLHLSELERDYVSDDTWKVSSSPAAGWMDVDHDDSAWPDASELADRGSVPGCDPASDFPTSSSARWIGSAPGGDGPIVLRKRIRVAPVGFGEATTGGGGADPVLVSTWEELELAADSDTPTVIALPEGTYDLRGEERDQEVCPIPCPDEPEKIQNQVLVNGATCADPLITVQRNDRILALGSNKTIVGLGRGAAVRGVTFDFQESQNIIVRNIALYDINPHLREAGDAFGLSRPSRVWIDHGTVKWVSDGFTDLREGSADVTVSYMHYDGEAELVCGGWHAWTSGITDSTITLHHNRYDHVNMRAPAVTGSAARAHLFNNVFSNASGWTVGATCLAQVLLEANTFEDVAAATQRRTCSDGTGLGLISAAPGANLYRDDSNVHLGGDGTEPADPVFAPSYAYVLETAGEAWPQVVSRAGTGGPWALPLVRD